MKTAGLLIVGASGLAREIIASGLSGVVGVVDDDVDLHGTDLAGVPVVGSIGDAVDRTESLLVCIGPSTQRRSVVRRLSKFGVADERFASYTAASVIIGSTSTVGVGSILLDGVVVTADVAIRRHVVVMPNCTITHDCILEDFATLAAGVALGGGVRVHNAAYLGMNASVRQRLTIGESAVIGMGSAVVQDVPHDQTWAGVPARPLQVPS